MEKAIVTTLEDLRIVLTLYIPNSKGRRECNILLKSISTDLIRGTNSCTFRNKEKRLVYYK